MSSHMRTAILWVDGLPYILEERTGDAFRARLLTDSEKELAIRILENAHAEAEAHIKGFDG